MRNVVCVCLIGIVMLASAGAQSAKITLTWAPATDETTPQSGLAYEVRRSELANINTSAEMEANGTVIAAGLNLSSIEYFLLPGTHWYNVSVKDNAGNKAVYRMVAVTDVLPPVTQAPTIQSQPRDLTVKAGQPATFAVTATGVPAPVFQWRRNGVDIFGATGASLTFTTKKQDNNAKFLVVVRNSAGSVTSRTATLHVRN